MQCAELKKQTDKSKDDLLAAILEQRHLQQLLSTEQGIVHRLTREKEDLINELNCLRNMKSNFQRKEESYMQDLRLSEESLSSMSSVIKELEQQLDNYRNR